MIIIWGWRRYIQQLAMLTLICQGCHNPSAHTLRRAVTKFTFFFIPLFPVSSRYFLQCTFCGAQGEINKETAEQMRVQDQRPAQPVGLPYPPQQGYSPTPGYPPAQGMPAMRQGYPQQQYPLR